MNKNIKNKVGETNGMLTVIKFIGHVDYDKRNKKRIHWLVRCECGVEKILPGCKISRDKSCGCHKYKTYLFLNACKKHGATRSVEYSTWIKLKARCYNVNDLKYPNYGGRGIKVCDRWISSFENFLSDMGHRPADKKSIDRIDVNGDYAPLNCRWSDDIEQMNNTTRNTYFEYKGETMSMANWARRLQFKYTRLQTLLVRKSIPLKDIIELNIK